MRTLDTIYDILYFYKISIYRYIYIHRYKLYFTDILKTEIIIIGKIPIC